MCQCLYRSNTWNGTSVTVAASAVRFAVRHPRYESSHPSPLPRIQRNVLKRQEGARVDWSGEPGSMVRGGAGSFARLVVPLWPPSRLGLLVVVLNLVRSPWSLVKKKNLSTYNWPLLTPGILDLSRRDRSRDPGARAPDQIPRRSNDRAERSRRSDRSEGRRAIRVPGRT